MLHSDSACRLKGLLRQFGLSKRVLCYHLFNILTILTFSNVVRISGWLWTVLMPVVFLHASRIKSPVLLWYSVMWSLDEVNTKLRRLGRRCGITQPNLSFLGWVRYINNSCSRFHVPNQVSSVRALVMKSWQNSAWRAICQEGRMEDRPG